MDTAFSLPAYWDRERVERCRADLITIRDVHGHNFHELEKLRISDAITLLYYVLNPGEISHDTSDGPIGMDEVDHD